MRKMMRNRAVGEALDGVETHWDEYRSEYIAGAFGFLLGGLVVMTFTAARNNQTKLVVIK